MGRLDAESETLLPCVAPTIEAVDGRKWGSNQWVNNGKAIVQPIPLDMRNAGRDPEKHDEMNRQGVGVGEPGDPAHTVTSAFVHAVAQPIAWSEELTASIDLAGTIQRGGAGGRHDGVAVALRGREGGATAELGDDAAFALRASSGGGDKPHIMAAMQVRRLTPVECERLQGFPDGYTNIPWSAAKEAARKGISYEAVLALRGMTLRGPNLEDCPDGPRYKALGNSWAVPVVRWIGERIQKVIENANP
jgi:DNA (cytosine-5)-methyltransferase 1